MKTICFILKIRISNCSLQPVSWELYKLIQIIYTSRLALELFIEVLSHNKSLSITALIGLRACSHEPGTVNYPGVMIVPGQALPRVHMKISCPGATLPWVNFIAPGQVHRHLIATNLSEFL